MKEEDYSMGMTSEDWMHELVNDRSGMFYNGE